MEDLLNDPFFKKFEHNDFINNSSDDSDHEMEKSSEDDDSGFVDFLILKKISGTEKNIYNTSRIPASLIKDSGQVVEISDKTDFDDDENEKPQTVIINRSEIGEITSIEVVCSCGERTIIKFEEED